MQGSAPTLATERLVLRAFRAGDLDAFAAIHARPEVTRHLGTDRPFTREESWRRLLMTQGLWPVVGYGYWAVELKSDGRLVGHCGFGDFARDMQPSIAGEPEMGWIFDPSVHGHGIAFEAGAAALAWADEALRPLSYPAIVAPGNAPSIRLAGKLGFERKPDAVYRGEPIALFRRAGPAA